ncbi:MAG: methyltransferase domain-containing protein [Pseudomonadota bacterium]|nr:methyltransferase domain-containing protein [Pseudomonadota bacterium]
MDTDSGRENYILGYGDSALAWMKSRTVDHHGAFLLPYLEPGMSLLDCGCGPGSLTLGFAAKLAPGSVVGIDCEPEQFAAAADYAAEQGMTKLRFESGDIYALPFDDASFDVVFCSAVLGSVHEPRRVVEEMVRVLKCGGIIAMKEFDHAADIIYPQTPVIARSIELYHRLRAHNGHAAQVGRQLKGIIHEAGCTVEYFRAVFDQQTEQEGLRACTERNNDLFFEVLGPQYQALGWCTPKQLEADVAAWREFAEDPAALYMAAWMEAVGRK